ncbi:MAG TPA: undecaprenyl-diphosphate phosphatase [Clostridiaceae bacterium]|nr:undecaprenyl-diphosphate phosphatase [Clostridiaceae bacterium]
MFLIEFLKVILLGIVEGITEWLPISSTGHMILLDEFIHFKASEAFKDMFIVVIQLGAIFAVVLLYFNRLNPFSPKKTGNQRKETFSIWFKVLVGIIPAGVAGVLFEDLLEERLYNYITVSLMLIIYGVLFIIIENRNKSRRKTINSFKDLTYETAFFIGVFQMLSLIPGTSRSGATILGAILLGVSRPVAAEFSFFLSIPVMFGASAVKLLKFGFDFTGTEMAFLLTGMVVAFIVSIIAIKFLMRYIKNNDFKAFGLYRIILGIIVIGYFAITGAIA